MLKTVLLIIFHFFFFSFIGLAGAGQESINLLNLYDTTSEVLRASSRTGLPIAVSVSNEDLNDVSSSVLMTETWLRTHVLPHYPASQITTIVVGNSILCLKDQEHKLGLVLPSLKNIHHSLTRWGLEKDIKVSAAFSSSCLRPYSTSYREDFSEKFIRPLLEFLHGINSSYFVNPLSKSTPLPDEAMSLVSSHTKCMKKLGFFELNKINVPIPSKANHITKIAGSPLHSSVGYSVPANVAKHPHPPLSQVASPPQETPPLAQVVSPSPLAQMVSPPLISFPSAPEIPPVFDPATPPFGFTLPPCNPSYPIAPVGPAPGIGVVQKLWCVAKPSVPAETLQEAIDYACGEGGADCDEIRPHGNCYSPDTVVAHASYAFNSYWQKNKRNGGSCSFGGTAMLINNDPSFLHCRFVLT
ncbi:hypothetical protein FNV43_RR19117 [Rhamnella rubrinervis]|uniref:glucan endo-1,3-beta-D-glucosidase n=1 Tax=Rhamnella rubrinervis TaxID=2594499 RepID=A0A8K0GWN1_9ROSA|nr:hypothetical protein FNV43_RR19117 [Rhamnella rubrinervis]